MRRRSGAVAHLHVGEQRVIVVGLGAGDPSAEAVRVAAAQAEDRAQALGTRTLHWILPRGLDAATATAAIVEGTLLRGWR